MRYANYKPTSYDHHIKLEGREDWLVVGVCRTRDSGPLEESNFHSALERLGNESETVEVHRFGHWGPGWFEIILAHGSHEKEVNAIKAELEDYPVLDENDLSEREMEAADEAWENYCADDIRRKLVRTFGLSDTTSKWFTNDRLMSLYNDYSSGTEHRETEVIFPDSWITETSFTREVLATWIRKRRTSETR